MPSAREIFWRELTEGENEAALELADETDAQLRDISHLLDREAAPLASVPHA